jgi:hypothetical protein
MGTLDTSWKRVPRFEVAVVVLAMAAAACGGSGNAAEDETPGQPSQEQAALAAEGVAARFDGVGIGVFDDVEGSGDTDSPIRLIDDQIDGLVAELNSGGGVTGAQLDDLVPMPDDAPPFSYLVAGWLDSVDSPETEYALELMGGRGAHDWTRTTDVIFPNAVLMLFVSNIGREVADEAGVDFEASPAAQEVILAAGESLTLAQNDVCSQLQGWLNKVLTALFDVLKIEESTWIPGFIQVIWNAAVDIAKTVITGLIEVLTAPILQAIKVGIGIVGTLALAASFLKSWTVEVMPSPIIDHFAHPGEPDHDGTFTASVGIGKDASFAAALVKCAEVAGFTLPSPLPPGKPIEWDMNQLGAITVATDIGHDDEIRDDSSAQLRYRTGREGPKDPEGDLHNGSVQVIATVERLSEEDLQALLDTMMFKGTVGELLGKVLGALLGDVKDKLSALMDVNGSIVLAVDYHVNEEEDEPEEAASCFQGVWSSTSYHAMDQTVTGGPGIELIIGSNLNGTIDFDGSEPIVGSLNFSGAPQTMVVQAGGATLTISEASEGHGTVSASATHDYSAIPFVFLDEWVQSGPGTQSLSGGGANSLLQLTCGGDTITWDVPGISGYVFERVGAYAGELPPPDTGSGDGDDSPPSTVPPDWGESLDACSLLTLKEVRSLAADAEKPEGEDDLSSQFFHQCTYSPALSIQATPPQQQEGFREGAESFGFAVLEIDGIGDWALAMVNIPDPDFGTDDSVFTVVATSADATVSIVPWTGVHEDTAEWETLLELLEIALGNV